MGASRVPAWVALDPRSALRTAGRRQCPGGAGYSPSPEEAPSRPIVTARTGKLLIMVEAP